MKSLMRSKLLTEAASADVQKNIVCENAICKFSKEIIYGGLCDVGN